MGRFFTLLSLALPLLAAFPHHARAEVQDMGPAGVTSSPVWEAGDRVSVPAADRGVPAPAIGDRLRPVRPKVKATPRKPQPQRQVQDQSRPVPRSVAKPQPEPKPRPKLKPAPKAKPALAKRDPVPAVRKKAAIDEDAFLCRDAPKGMTVPVPAPFGRWLVLVCSTQGQALVPVLGMAWVAHGSEDTVSILALPPGREPKPASAEFDPRYAYRFTRLAGGKLEGEGRKQAASLLAAASGDNDLSTEEIWRLDAVSNVGGTTYNLFFYLGGDAPTQIIACLDRCTKALFLDVVDGAEARAAISASPLRR